MKTTLIPTLISRVFDPPLLLVVLTAIGFIFFSERIYTSVELSILLLVMVGLPFVGFLLMMKKHLVSNWDVTKRVERFAPLSLFLFTTALDIVLLLFFREHQLLSLFILYFLWVFGFFIITLVWKISGHTSIVTLVTGVLYYWFGTGAVGMIPAILLVAWARLVRKDHTLLQVAGGIVYSILLLSFWRLFFYSY